MKLIVGLGNPGTRYSGTRHNIGAYLAKRLLLENKARARVDSNTRSLIAKIRIQGCEVLVATPLVFMNLSGGPVKALLKKHKLGLEDLLIICDDLDLEFGRIKIRPAGSSGGHNGLSSVIDSLGSREFGRLRVGIGRPPKNIDAASYVLLPFSRKEQAMLPGLSEEALACCRSWAVQGIAKTMNLYNRTKKEQVQ